MSKGVPLIKGGSSNMTVEVVYGITGCTEGGRIPWEEALEMC